MIEGDPAEAPWAAPSLAELPALFEGFGAAWWVAGGWAIDLHLGRQTRPHGDLDTALLRRDQPALRTQFSSWDIHVAHDGRLTPWDGDPLEHPRHQFWARPHPGAPWSLEFLLEDVDVGGHDWLFRRDHRVTMPLSRFGRVSSDGLPYVCPEVALLYKAKGHDIERNARDFAAALPSLDAGARAWLRDALTTQQAGHPWLARLQPAPPAA
ncbi:MAG: amino acid transporter [Dehalococcoidia bacterium]